jgi:uncharacterized cupin superfamily protein
VSTTNLVIGYLGSGCRSITTPTAGLSTSRPYTRAVPEARLDDSGSGLAPAGEGWFVVNARDAEWWTSETFGSGCGFESTEASFPQLGINLSVLEPGEPNCLYHSESQQEAFLVLSGECRLLVDGAERPLRPWDFFHCPAGTEHVFVGAGDGPCVILMAGARTEDEQLLYPVSELATRYDASAEEETPDSKQAYARFDRPQRARPSYWDRLPWA